MANLDAFAVSVVAPSYNHARYIGAAISSVLQQTYPAAEVVVVDDCSTDDSWNVLKGIQHPKLRVHKNKANEGSYATLNRAISLCASSWIAVINTDDAWAPEKLGAQMEALTKSGLDWSITLGALIDASGKTVAEAPWGDWPKEPRADLLPYLLEENRVLHSSLVARRELMGYDSGLRYSGDWSLLLDMARRGPGACVPEPLTFWRQHDANTYVRSPAQTLEEFRLRRRILMGTDWPDTPLTLKKLSRCAMHQAALCVLCGHMPLARAFARKGADIDPSSEAKNRLRVCLLPGPLARRRLWGNVPSLGLKNQLNEILAMAPV